MFILAKMLTYLLISNNDNYKVDELCNMFITLHTVNLNNLNLKE